MNLSTPCKVWAGAIEKTGYGRRKVKGKMWMAHRFAYQEHYGNLDPDMVVDHLCFNRACVEPTHLRQVSREENSVRHNPDCKCVACRPEEYTFKVCSAGHDLTLPGARYKRDSSGQIGQCVKCDRRRQKLRWARSREASVAV